MTERLIFAGPVTAEGRTIRGSVVLAGSRTRRNGEWLEVDPAALVKADASDVKGRFNHDADKVMGRTSNGTVRFERTETGIAFEIDVNETSFGNDALVMARRGDFGGSSFEIEGLRSTFSTDPETGDRVRRITSIARLTDVSPVIDPAFLNSSVAAFGKENEMPEPTTPEPVTPPPAPPVAPPTVEPVARKSDKSDTYLTAEAFARKQDIGDLEAAMGNLIANGEMTAAQTEAYDAFAHVYDERKAIDTKARDHVERLALAHQLRTGKGPKAPTGGSDVYASKDYDEAFALYLGSTPQTFARNTARLDELGAQQFAQSIAGDGTQGGFTVPDGFRTKISERLKAFGGIAPYAEPYDTNTGEPVRWPSNDDTANVAAIAAEGAAGAAGADLVFGSITLGAFSYDANGASNVPLRLSLELIQDSATGIVNMVERKLAERIGRKQAAHIATGVGTTEPVGLLSQTPDTMTATAVSLAAPEHILQVDSAYRDLGNCRWVMSDATLLKIWQSQTTTNQPLFIPGGSDIIGRPGGTLFGYPVSIDPAAGTLVAFGDIGLAYVIRRVRDIQVLVDPYSRQGTREVCYHAWARMDANIQDPFAFSVSEWSTVSADT